MTACDSSLLIEQSRRYGNANAASQTQSTPSQRTNHGRAGCIGFWRQLENSETEHPRWCSWLPP
jgi:hypothetical protein